MTELSERVAALPRHQRAALAKLLRQRRSGGEIRGERRESGDFPLSFAQERLWFLDQLMPDSPAYNLSFVRRLGFAVERLALEQALAKLVGRHESLRTTFLMVGDAPVQRVHARAPVDCRDVDLQQLPRRRRLAEAERLAAAIAREPFDLASGPVFRCAVLRLGRAGDVFVLVIHHIVADAWSLELIFEELAALYGAILRGVEADLPVPGPQYADYAVWQRRYLSSDTLERLERHWRQRLEGLATLEMPTDRPRPSVQTARGDQILFDLGAAVTAAVHRVARQSEATPFMVLLAAFLVLLHRYTHQDDVVVGTPVASRNRLELERVVGFFANALVLRTDLGGNPTFAEVVARARATTLDAFEHQDMPFSKLVSCLKPRQDLSRNPLFQVSFQLLSSPSGKQVPGVEPGAEILIERGSAVFDLSLNLVATGDVVRGQLEFNSDLFDRVTIEAMAGHFRTLVEQATAAPHARVGELTILTAGEQERLAGWERGPIGTRVSETVPQWIDRVAAGAPLDAAVQDPAGSMTFGEMRERARRLAAVLLELQPARGTVALLMQPSADMIAATIGVLYAGHSYLPIDPATPPGRRNMMLEDAGVSIVVADAGMDTGPLQLTVLDAPLVMRSEATPLLDELPDIGPGDRAYLMFTSGSSGRPKGVSVNHGNLANYLRWSVREYPVSAGRGAPLTSTVASDMAVTTMFAPLVSGKTVFVLEQSDILEALDRALRSDADFSFVKLTPSHLHALRQLAVGRAPPTGTRAFVIGGEALRGEALQPWAAAAPDLRIWNEYGPTETTVACCAHLAVARDIGDGPVPIGRPIVNTVVRVLDEYGQPVPAGVVGELLIGGHGVADGYVADDQLTAARFIDGVNRWYRSGDLVRWTREGRLVYVGRTDRQVKIRGHRIEAGDVESVLEGHQDVEACVVVARTLSHDDRRLVAYVASRSTADVLVPELTFWARRHLPVSMLPSRYVVLDRFPRNASGKVDLHSLEALAQPHGGESGSTPYVAPRTALEQVIVRTFVEVLGAGGEGPVRIGVDDDFFDERGGDSLLATRVVARLREYLATDVALRALFEHPTCRSFAEQILAELPDRASVERRAVALLEVMAMTDEDVARRLGEADGEAAPA